MFLILGVIAILATILNLYLYKAGKDFRLAMVMGLSFTSLTLLAEYIMVSNWVKAEEWSSLADVVPTMANALIILTFISIFLNLIPLLIDLKKEK